MASKSRLGKGLGALFPDLPGEESEKKELKVSRETPSAVKPVVKPIAPAPASKTEAKPAKKTSSKNRRAAMPTLDDIAHPSDMFFSDTVGITPAPAKKAITAVEPSSSADAGEKDDKVSRETPSSATDAKGDKDTDKEPELKPVVGGYLAELKLDEIGPNAHQPRTVFDEDDLNELAASIKEVGVLQPIVVRKRPQAQIDEARRKQEGHKPANRFDGHLDSPYELIMGERRWRASQLAELDTIPAIVKTTADDDMLRDALLENLHRVALNPLEEAAAYQQMIDEFGLTQAQLSKSVSKSRPQIANTLRLLNLPSSVQKKVAAGILTAGHARALLGLNDTASMDKLANRIIAEGLSVRSTEEIVSMANLESKEPKKPKTNKNNPWAGSPIQTNLENRFDTKVSIKGTPKHGRIEIVFSSPEDMDRILGLLMPDKGDASSSSDGKGQWV
ncbi:ParB/RepB/Spo0J family partition protein [Bifidobacterium saguinibicoloris]|uniref:ParB/RepB/Spo0J family partition protein n=1 Tax=Bifidobacterium saguinibicoloris TaxID=2834433 RepID=UPI001C583F3D|nr:ParB/RepB/Spo0J family partition protein [Bifidobacterium saguinibicoloris]MBW3081378.1 ParB/RepB/Spo0J family partition protein [Bifidobacterium saguinibicoloris]